MTRGEVIEEYKNSFNNGTEGSRLLKTMKILNGLKCSDEEKADCLREEIDHIICAYIESK